MAYLLYRYVLNGEVKYVGKTKRDLARRVAEHSVEPKFQSSAKWKIEYFVVANSAQMDGLEKLLIDYYKPCLNVKDKATTSCVIQLPDFPWRIWDGTHVDEEIMIDKISNSNLSFSFSNSDLCKSLCENKSLKTEIDSWKHLYDDEFRISVAYSKQLKLNEAYYQNAISSEKAMSENMKREFLQVQTQLAQLQKKCDRWAEFDWEDFDHRSVRFACQMMWILFWVLDIGLSRLVSLINYLCEKLTNALNGESCHE